MTTRATRRRVASPVAMTLIELLVVIAIVIIVFAALIPNLRPAMESARLRETARQVNAYIASAQALAAQHGRQGVGVTIVRSAVAPGGALDLFTVESPQSYGGDSQNSYANVNGSSATLYDVGSLNGLVTSGDFIRFNHRGPFHQLGSVSPSGNTATVTFGAANGGYLPPTGNMPFLIYRKPVRSAVAAMQLPRGACIDLINSGLGPTGTFTSSTPLTIMFSPTGEVSTLYDGNSVTNPANSIYLLIGKFDKLGVDNLKDLENRWVSIRQRTGQVTTEGVARSSNESSPTITEARKYAVEGKGMGGI